MKKIRIFLLAFLLIIFINNVYAHSGRTDSYGGHYDYSTGTYHYHDGSYEGEYARPIEEGGESINTTKEYNESVNINKEDISTNSLRQYITEEVYNTRIENLQQQINEKDNEIKSLKSDLDNSWIDTICLAIICIIVTCFIKDYRNSKD